VQHNNKSVVGVYLRANGRYHNLTDLLAQSRSLTAENFSKISMHGRPVPQLERLNRTLQSIVERGILLDAERGAVDAWIFMTQNGVCETIMLRVLSHPNQRRISDLSIVRHARSDGLPLRLRRTGVDA